MAHYTTYIYNIRNPQHSIGNYIRTLYQITQHPTAAAASASAFLEATGGAPTAPGAPKLGLGLRGLGFRAVWSLVVHHPGSDAVHSQHERFGPPTSRRF